MEWVIVADFFAVSDLTLHRIKYHNKIVGAREMTVHNSSLLISDY
jgi:hypothetical protein